MLSKIHLPLLLTLAACYPPDQVKMHEAADSGTSTTPTSTSTSTNMPPPPPPADAGPPPAQCENAAWNTPAGVPGISDANAIFGSITPDELTIAWMTNDGAIHWADRAQKTDPFANENSVMGDFAIGRVNLSSDGLRIIVPSANQRTFGQITRTSRSDAFDPTLDTYPFAGLNASVKERNKTGRLADVVMSADERTLVFTYTGVATDSTVQLSHRMSKMDAWGVGLPIKQTGLEPVNGDIRRPTGSSTDNRTIFFWDEHNGTQVMAMRDDENAMTFTKIVDIGVRPLAMPNADCTALAHGANIDMKFGALGIASSQRK